MLRLHLTALRLVVLQLIIIYELPKELQDALRTHNALFVDGIYPVCVLFLLGFWVGRGHAKLLLEAHDELLILKLYLLDCLQYVWVDACVGGWTFTLFYLWVTILLLAAWVLLLG